MNTQTVKRHRKDKLHASGLAFWMIRLMHDNPLLPLLKNPLETLKAAGLKPGQRVLEVGCGPGFYTIPAAKIVGADGILYAMDVNPRAIKLVENKMRKFALGNIKPVVGNAADTGLPDGGLDLVFVFGIGYIAGGMDNLLKELHRVIKTGGVLAFEKTHGSDEKLAQEVQRAGFDHPIRNGRIFLFTKRQT